MNKTIIIIWERQIRASFRSRDHLHRARSKSKMKFQDVGVHRRYRMSLCSVSSYSLSLSFSLLYSLFSFSRGVLSPRTMRYFSFQTGFRGCTVVIHGTMPIQPLYRLKTVPIEQWPPTLCYRASDRKEFDVTKNSTGQWSSFLKSEGG